MEDFYRSVGCEPASLPRPSPSSGIASARAAATPSGAAFGQLAGGRAAGAGAGAGSGRATLQGAQSTQPAKSGGGGGGIVVEDGAWGGELRQLLKVAGCLHHLDRFRTDQLDGEVLLMMERRDFERMGVTEVGWVLL